ncbi:Coenzyme F420 hydrogenase/dehydrogenase, beta subunit C-terminal domain [Terrisporobacter petrolearius]|uniref:Coenzyme F420 hydrogenase/dehydrogenase, beta subunit C-terminal domain n=1 Tax=Terrisporobacter petrolearius TaxID=1460447 RepID=UPI0022E53ED2|nr:Coenzyme F420 hydrogenase/dehydrogenase, beta subunit C-terminal domain [Terrisporobacter petrolearius]
MIEKLNYSRCTICQACSNICPKDCIDAKFLKEEFYYPVIDKENCINCGACEKVCPVLNPLELYQPLKKAYAGINKNSSERLKSSSGGLFTGLANCILEENGIVCGAAFDEKFQVSHKIIDNKVDLVKLRGSKYVQSNTKYIFREIKEYLKLNKKVLFTGCPCQVAGLKKFLGKDYQNLFTIDFICHGIPSQNTFDRYIKFLQNVYKSKVIEFLFRDKTKGWHTSSVKVTFENGKIYTKFITEDMYMRGFLNNLYCKQSCHNCLFRNHKSGSDITLADYWGAEVEEREMDDNKGLSLIIINSTKGEMLKDNIKKTSILKLTKYDNAIKYNQSIIKSSPVSINRNKFLNLSEQEKYDDIFRKLCKEKNSKVLIRKSRQFLGKIKRLIIYK